MPYIVTIRPAETVGYDIPHIEALDAFNAAALDALPEGHDLVDTDKQRSIGIARRHEFREVTIEDRGAFEESVPDGWQAISVRSE